jgi:hypothetical protein
MRYLSIGSVIKDEQLYLKEWIEYHLLIGVEHFYILDNSEHNLCWEVLQPYVQAGIVTYERYPEKDLPQLNGFNKLINKTRGETYWLGLIDPDEFIFIKKNKNCTVLLPDTLRFFEQYAALAIHWLCFGASGRKYTQEATLNLYYRSNESNEVNRKIKCIVQPELTVEAAGSHYFRYSKDNFAVNENYQKMPSGNNGHKSWKPDKHTSNWIRINHYPIRSRQNLLEKIERGFVDMAAKGGQKINWLRYKQEYNGKNSTACYDDSMKPYYKILLNNGVYENHSRIT